MPNIWHGVHDSLVKPQVVRHQVKIFTRLVGKHFSYPVECLTYQNSSISKVIGMRTLHVFVYPIDKLLYQELKSKQQYIDNSFLHDHVLETQKDQNRNLKRKQQSKNIETSETGKRHIFLIIEIIKGCFTDTH